MTAPHCSLCGAAIPEGAPHNARYRAKAAT